MCKRGVCQKCGEEFVAAWSSGRRRTHRNAALRKSTHIIISYKASSCTPCAAPGIMRNPKSPPERTDPPCASGVLISAVGCPLLRVGLHG